MKTINATQNTSNIAIISNAPDTDFITEVLNPIAQRIQELTSTSPEHLQLQSLQWLTNDNYCTCNLTFSHTASKAINVHNITYPLSRILINELDNTILDPDYIITNSTFIYSASFEF